eukprot:m.10489 g.10489  ORF g.10489 m.10489 type:complete len:817 (+) comp2751_c0_seq1:94-2544(+)
MRLPSPGKVAVVCGVVFVVVGVYEWGSGPTVRNASLQHDAFLRDAEARARLDDVKRRDVEAEPDMHLQAHDGDKRPLRLNEGGIPDGYFPIDIDTHSEDPLVKFCRLDMQKYSDNPSATPMFKDLLRLSQCSGDHVLTKRVSDINAIDVVIPPTAFVFHQSRCGSTLTANILAADPANLVFSESNPPASVALHCEHCSEAQQIAWLQAVVKGMGNSFRHRRLFFKFQSANTPLIELYAKAFPEVPWIYVYRDPVEIMVSHLKQGAHTRSAPCLRKRYASEISAFLTPLGKSAQDNVAYCAAYLTMLNNGALKALHNAGSRGLPVRYDDIPHTLMDKVFPRHFGYTPSPDVRSLMMDQLSKYSKDRHHNMAWSAKGDSEEKHRKASPEMNNAAEVILSPSFKELNTIRDTKLTRLAAASPLDGQNAPQGRDKLDEVVHRRVAQGEQPAKAGDLLIPPAEVPPPDQYLPKGEPLLDRQGNYMPLCHRPDHKKDGGPDGRGIYEETEKQYLPYPKLVPLTDILKRWPPDEPDVPDIENIRHGSLEVFDYQNLTQRARADWLRYNEVPFKMYNVPGIDRAVDLWKSDEYLINKFGDAPQRVTSSTTNHFMYYRKRRGPGTPRDYKAPTGMEEMTFAEWLHRAKGAEDRSKPVESPHWYLQLNSVGPKRWILDDVTPFQPVKSFFIADPQGNRGINCRFGARGIIAEGHYDGGRNFVTILRGAKRYILLPPSECSLLYLWPKGHPEGRHVRADWSKLNLTQYPQTAKAKATEVVLSEGEVLYIPSYWFHYIISTTVSMQCNTRSGNSIRGRDVLTDCGFYF